MSDLVSRKDVIEGLYNINPSEDMLFIDAIVDMVENLPSTEQKIIYCKDCKFAHLTVKGRVKYCDVWFPETKTYLGADNFCSSAEKRGE